MDITTSMCVFGLGISKRKCSAAGQALTAPVLRGERHGGGDDCAGHDLDRVALPVRQKERENNTSTRESIRGLQG